MIVKKHQSVRAKMGLDYKSIYEWDVIIENYWSLSWFVVCASENFNYEIWAGNQSIGWML